MGRAYFLKRNQEKQYFFVMFYCRKQKYEISNLKILFCKSFFSGICKVIPYFDILFNERSSYIIYYYIYLNSKKCTSNGYSQKFAIKYENTGC